MITPTLSGSCWMPIKEVLPKFLKKSSWLGREACWLVGDAYLWICDVFHKVFIRPEKRILITSTSFTYGKITPRYENEDKKE